jgi:hypothetical protein
MENPQNRDHGMANLAPLSGRVASGTPPSEKSARTLFKRFTADPPRAGRTTPATPLMMSPTAAWRMFCCKTGGSVSLVTFYRWIREGRVCAIRTGRKIHVPIHMLDLVIQKCLNGDDLL